MDQYFDGFNVVFVGNYKQLPSVGGKHVYDERFKITATKSQSIRRSTMQSLSEPTLPANELTQIVKRHSSRPFSHLGQSQVIIDDWRLLMTGNTSTASDRDDPKWRYAVHLFFSNKYFI